MKLQEEVLSQEDDYGLEVGTEQSIVVLPGDKVM